MTQMQKKLLNILKFFHTFCEEYDLCYYAIGGTALGAARHKGFIPWDDDIDVGMPREDYQRLISLWNDECGAGKYRLESPHSEDAGYTYPFAKIFDTETTLIENTKYRLVRGIYMDVFPLDGAGNSEEEAKRVFRSIAATKNLLALRTMAVTDRAAYKNAIVRMAHALPRGLVDDKKLCLKIDNKLQRHSFSDSSYVGNYVGAWGLKEIMPKDLYGAPTLYPFEDTMIYSVAQPDAYLTHLYGDWRELPPEEKRVSHHDYIVDLDRSYLLEPKET